MPGECFTTTSTPSPYYLLIRVYLRKASLSIPVDLELILLPLLLSAGVRGMRHQARLSFISLKDFKICYIISHVYMCAHKTWHTCGGQRTTSWSWFPPSTFMWVKRLHGKGLYPPNHLTGPHLILKNTLRPQDGSAGKGLAVKTENLSSMLGTLHDGERTDSGKLSLDPHTCHDIL